MAVQEMVGRVEPAEVPKMEAKGLARLWSLSEKKRGKERQGSARRIERARRKRGAEERGLTSDIESSSEKFSTLGHLR